MEKPVRQLGTIPFWVHDEKNGLALLVTIEGKTYLTSKVLKTTLDSENLDIETYNSIYRLPRENSFKGYIEKNYPLIDGQIQFAATIYKREWILNYLGLTVPLTTPT